MTRRRQPKCAVSANSRHPGLIGTPPKAVSDRGLNYTVTTECAMSKKSKQNIEHELIETLSLSIDNILFHVDDSAKETNQRIDIALKEVINQLRYIRTAISKKQPIVINDETTKLIIDKIIDGVTDDYRFNEYLRKVESTYLNAAERIAHKEIKIRWYAEDEGVRRLIQNTEDKIDRLNAYLDKLIGGAI
jgi:hypothetical protein